MAEAIIMNDIHGIMDAIATRLEKRVHELVSKGQYVDALNLILEINREIMN